MKLLVSCLESSANLHFGEVLKHLKNTEIYGIFSSEFGRPMYDSTEFSAMGFIEILPLILKAKKAMKQMLDLAAKCDVCLLIDSPAFNLRFAQEIKKAKLPCKVVYYVLPQVWAWKKGRAKIVDENCDVLASIWPFEKDFYPRAVFVGHPLLDELNSSQNSQKSGIISFLPGSRRAEIKALMPFFRQIAPKINARKLLVVPTHLSEKINEFYGDTSEFEIFYGAENALKNSDFAFICSGTATLQAALIGTPFVLCYKARTFDVWLARRLVNLKHAGLANIIFDFLGLEPLNTELIQEQITEKSLLDAYENYDPKKFSHGAKILRDYLKFGSAKNVADLLV